MPAESLYLAGNSGVLQTNVNGSNRQALAYAHPDEYFADVAVNSQTGVVYWVRRTIGSGIVRHVPGKVDSVVAAGFDFGNCLTVDEDAGRLYSGGAVIARCGLNGENLETVTSDLEGSLVLAIDIDPLGGPAGGEMYWSEYTSSHEGRIVRASAFRGVNRQIIVTGLGLPLDISLDVVGRKVYWVDWARSKVQRANLDGSAVETVVASGLVNPSSITFDLTTSKLYWVDEGTEMVQRSNLDGSNQETLFTVYNLNHLAIGPNGVVGVDKQTWGQIKQLYRGGAR
jgi:hypothetical protein